MVRGHVSYIPGGRDLSAQQTRVEDEGEPPPHGTGPLFGSLLRLLTQIQGRG